MTYFSMKKCQNLLFLRMGHFWHFVNLVLSEWFFVKQHFLSWCSQARKVIHPGRGSKPQPPACKSSALPTELPRKDSSAFKVCSYTSQWTHHATLKWVSYWKIFFLLEKPYTLDFLWCNNNCFLLGKAYTLNFLWNNIILS